MKRSEVKNLAQEHMLTNREDPSQNTLMYIHNNDKWDELVVEIDKESAYIDMLEKANKISKEMHFRGRPHLVYLNGMCMGSFDTIALAFEQEATK